MHGAPTPAATSTPNSGVRRRAPHHQLERNHLQVYVPILGLYVIAFRCDTVVEEGAGDALPGGTQTLRLPMPERNALRRSMRTGVPAPARTAQLMEQTSATIPD